MFSSASFLEYVAIDILGPLPRLKAGSQFAIIMTDRYTKLTNVIPTTKMTLTQVANNFFND